MKINSECKPVELTKQETVMIKRINGYTGKAVVYFLAIICFGFGGVALFIEGNINIIVCIFSVLFGLLFAKVFYDHVRQKTEYAFYGIVTKKEVRYGMNYRRSSPLLTDYSRTVPQKTKEYSRKYYFVSVLINGVEIENICCLYVMKDKINTGDEVIIEKGYSPCGEYTVYRK